MANSHSTVAHNFAHLTGKSKNGGSMFYDLHSDDCATIYSYGHHFGIAYILPDRYGVNPKKALFTEREYSVSTSQHKTIVRSAISHYDIISVPKDATRYNCSFGAKLSTYHCKDDLQHWNNEIERLVSKHLKARTRSYWPAILRIINNADKYCDLFKCRKHLSGILKKTVKHIDDPDLIFNILFSDEQKTKIAERDRLQKEREKRKQADQLKRFRNFETNYLFNSKYTYLRARPYCVQTSKGVSIGFDDVSKLLSLYQYVAKTGETIVPDLSVQGYEIDQITPDYIRAGCHLIPRSEILYISNQLKG